MKIQNFYSRKSICLLGLVVLLVVHSLSLGWAAEEEMTPTPTVTPTPMNPVETPTPSPDNRILGIVELDQPDLSSNHLVASPPAGFLAPKLSFGSIPERSGSDQQGLRIDLAQGQGTLLVSLEPIQVHGLARISGTFRATSQALTIAVIALNSPIDGQIGYSNITGPEIGIDQYRTMDLVYSPPSGRLQLAFQVVNMPFSALSGTVYLDHLSVEMLEPTIGDPVALEVPGDFESNLSQLYVNYNNVDGDVIPFFESITDVALRLSIQPENMAANFGTLVTGVEEQYPFSLLGEISVQRDSEPGGGMTGFVMTNGNQSIAVFRNTNDIPSSTTGVYEKLMLGGDFRVKNPNTPINIIVQNGGPGVSATLVADDLNLRKYASFDPIPPTPTPVPIEQTITIPLDLFEKAKPLEMVLIPPGTFTMGSPDDEEGRVSDEGPQHLVTISQPFYLGKYEVTQAQWEAVMGSNPSSWMGDNLPVERVSWNDVQEFLVKLNQFGQGTFRLPTEAEWEYACRAGTITRYYWGDDLNESQIDQYAWYDYNSYGKTHEVGQKLPNSWGLYDMSGNVWEWCQDWYSVNYHSTTSQTDPTGVISSSTRVNRGGGWIYYSGYCRSADRNSSSPDHRDYHIGFRLLKSYP